MRKVQEKATKTTEIQYVDKEDAAVSRKKKTAIVERELDALVAEHGAVSPEIMVSAARDEDHPLHPFFCWDDTEAARRYRIVQATNMILATRFVCVLKKQDDLQVAVAAMPGDRKVQLRKFLPAYDGQGGYSERPAVLADAEARANLIQRRLRLLQSWCEGVVDIKELDPVRLEIERLLAK